MVDDDMKMEALPDTNILKAVVTMEDKMDLERKGKQSYQGYLYVRLMAFGNGTLSSLYDRSDGFYRRQTILKVKEKDPDRLDDKKTRTCFEGDVYAKRGCGVPGDQRLHSQIIRKPGYFSLPILI